jgi:D-glycero-alpha-D-manno-heptose-7-phosphate kinase
MGELALDGPGTIVSRTPLRVSFAGGGTDMPAFFGQHPGAVVSTTINRYVYVQVKRHSELFFEPIRINYSQSEQVNTVDEIENNIARECLRLLDIDPPIYISTVGDVPASTGLGGSSAFCVGLLNALHMMKGERASPGQLAEEASHVEIDVLAEPIGKQDQYAAAYGGLNFFTFKAQGTVSVEHKWHVNSNLGRLFESIMMFWTGHQRDASGVLVEQQRNIEDRLDTLIRMRDQAHELEQLLDSRELDLDKLAAILDEGWQLKKSLASRITNPQIDAWYLAALDAGALGGKLCGAGGGGFLMLIVPPAAQKSVRKALHNLVHMPVSYESFGSQVVNPFDR